MHLKEAQHLQQLSRILRDIFLKELHKDSFEGLLFLKYLSATLPGSSMAIGRKTLKRSSDCQTRLALNFLRCQALWLSWKALQFSPTPHLCLYYLLPTTHHAWVLGPPKCAGQILPHCEWGGETQRKIVIFCAGERNHLVPGDLGGKCSLFYSHFSPRIIKVRT